MSSPQSIKINFFDINGEYREDVPINTEQNFLKIDSPMRIIDQYINENFLQNLKKTTENQSITKYKFSYEISQNNFISIICEIINNFSVSHQSILDSNGYIVFCNLESNTTFQLLEKIIEYIKDNCSINAKTYIIGVFKENIDDDKGNYEMKNFLSNLNFEYEYYEMYLGDKNNFELIKNEYDNAELMEEVFKIIFTEIYKGGKGPRFIKNTDGKVGGQDKSMGKCLLF